MSMSNSKGFTLLELLIALALMAMLTVVIGEILSIFIRSSAESAAVAEVNHNLRQTISRIGAEVGKASSINTPTPGSTGTTLKLDGDSSSCGSVGVKCFELSGDKVIFKNGTAPSSDVTSGKVGVTNFEITTLENGTKRSVLISLRIKYKSAFSAYEKEVRDVFAVN